MKKNEVNMLSGSIVKGLLAVTIPIMVMNVLLSLFNIIDMTMLGQFVDDNAVGAVGASGTLISLVTGLLIGIAAGANVIVAKYIGKGDEESVQRAVGTSILFSIVGGLFLTVVGISFAEIFLTWMNCPKSLFADAVLYFKLYFAGVPLLLLYNFIAAILRSMGDSKRPMYFLTFGGIVKVALNALFIIVFDMDVVGVALSTIISWAVSAILCFWALLKNKGIVQFKKKHFRFYKKELGEILFIGVPAGMQSALYSLANVIISATVNGFGEAATKGISIANQFDGVLYQISVAPSLAVMSFVSQNISAGNIRRVKQTAVKATFLAIAFGATFGALSAIFSGTLSSFMSSDPIVIEYSRQKMVLISSTYFICGINEIMCASLRGIGKPIIPTISTLIFMCGIRFIWVYLIFPLYKNLTFLYLIWPIGWVLSIVLLTSVFIPYIKKLNKTQIENKPTEKIG